jgi:hypothetical protein
LSVSKEELLTHSDIKNAALARRCLIRIYFSSRSNNRVTFWIILNLHFTLVHL